MPKKYDTPNDGIFWQTHYGWGKLNGITVPKELVLAFNLKHGDFVRVENILDKGDGKIRIVLIKSNKNKYL